MRGYMKQKIEKLSLLDLEEIALSGDRIEMQDILYNKLALKLNEIIDYLNKQNQ